MRLSITTPKGSLLDTEVEELIAPGVEGEFGVLPGHIPFLSALRPGVFAYRTKEGERVLAVSDGLLEVAQTAKGEQVLVLVSQAMRAANIDKESASVELADFEKQLADWKGEDGPELQVLRQKRAWAEARVNAAGKGAA